MPNPKMKTGRNLALICLGAIIVAFSMFGVTLRSKIERLSNRQKEPTPTAQSLPSPSAAKTNQTPVAVPQAPAQQEPHAVDERAWKLMRSYLGNWHSSSMEGTQVRIFNFELRDSPTIPGAYAGYSTLTEVALAPPNPLKPQVNVMEVMAAKTNPHAIVWIGEPEAGGVTFRVEKRIGTQDCPMTSLTATPFGANELVVEWKSDGCPDRRMLLSK